MALHDEADSRPAGGRSRNHRLVCASSPSVNAVHWGYSDLSIRRRHVHCPLSQVLRSHYTTAGLRLCPTVLLFVAASHTSLSLDPPPWALLRSIITAAASFSRSGGSAAIRTWHCDAAMKVWTFEEVTPRSTRTMMSVGTMPCAGGSGEQIEEQEAGAHHYLSQGCEGVILEG